MVYSGPPVTWNRLNGQVRVAGSIFTLVAAHTLRRCMLAPGGAVAFIVNLRHSRVGHGAAGGGAMPVVLARLEEYPVAGSYDLDRTTAALAQSETLGNVDGLAVGVGVPSCSCARREVDAARAQTRSTCRCCYSVNEDCAGEPLARPGPRLNRVSGNLHVIIPRALRGALHRMRLDQLMVYCIGNRVRRAAHSQLGIEERKLSAKIRLRQRKLMGYLRRLQAVRKVALKLDFPRREHLTVK
jgi:hypothetical protein